MIGVWMWSRFHEISQFDDTKKSCREKLAGHNERRRKTYADIQAENKQKRPTSIMGGSLLKAMRYSNYGEKSSREPQYEALSN